MGALGEMTDAKTDAKTRRAQAMRCGFVWGPVEVTRLTRIERSNGKYHILRINDLEIYVSPTGRTTRVFRNGEELKSDAAKERESARTASGDRTG
jgi:hypothetical protein